MSEQLQKHVVRPQRSLSGAHGLGEELQRIVVKSKAKQMDHSGAEREGEGEVKTAGGVGGYVIYIVTLKCMWHGTLIH